MEALAQSIAAGDAWRALYNSTEAAVRARIAEEGFERPWEVCRIRRRP